MPAAAPSRRPFQLVDLYKYGIRENQWTAMADKLRDDPAAVLRRRVKGQEPAIDKIVTVLKRSVLGFSGMQHSSGTKPKGVLFLAGPTGTGKTEMVKAVTELLFGDERSYLRFDMSEYAAENADQKLFGAPPGYVGYEAGGQLTNAVRANPFSVLLFDEVEKAHPSIMDKFLQILEDHHLLHEQRRHLRRAARRARAHRRTAQHRASRRAVRRHPRQGGSGHGHPLQARGLKPHRR